METANGEAVRSSVSDEVNRPQDESNRPARTRMPGGVAGERPVKAVPYADLYRARYKFAMAG
jgi:hypothetical protein